jgi:DNA-binding HxlR family transcriptional regulator
VIQNIKKTESIDRSNMNYIVSAHTEYYPTEKGMAVQRILVEISSFSAKYEPEIIFVDKKPRNNGTRNLSEVYDSLTTQVIGGTLARLCLLQIYLLLFRYNEHI